MKKAFAAIGTASLVVALAAAPTLATNGMNMIGDSPRSAGMGGADVAVCSDARSVAGNPAVVARTSPASATIGVRALMPSLSLDLDGAGPAPAVDGESQVFPLPLLGYVHSVADTPWAFGIGIFGQGGMGVSFKDLPTPMMTTDEITSQIQFARVNPLVSYAVNDDLTLGATVMLGYAMAKFTMFPETPIPGLPSGLKVEDLASWGYAGRVGAQMRIGDTFRVGATYTTQSAIEFDGGTATLNFGPMGGKQTYDAALEDFTWPQEAELGVAFLPAPGWTIAADVKWINWSATVDQPRLVVSNPPAGMPATPFPDATGMPASDTAVFDMKWEDQWVLALGCEFATEGGHAFRAGVNYGASPVPDANLNPLFPAIPETHLALGYGYTAGQWTFDVALEHALKKTQSASNPMMPVEIDHSQISVLAGASYRY